MLALALLDFAGALAAKEWANGGSPRWLFAGVGCFLLLSYPYAASLQYAELATVTMGWIVLLQVGLPALDRVRCDVALPPARWVAICLILVLQAYLVLAPAVPKSGAAKPPKCLSGLLVRTRYTGYTYSVCRSNKGCWPFSSRGRCTATSCAPSSSRAPGPPGR